MDTDTLLLSQAFNNQVSRLLLQLMELDVMQQEDMKTTNKVRKMFILNRG